MRHTLSLFTLASMVAMILGCCGDEDETCHHEDTAPIDPCRATVEQTTPWDGATDHFYQDAIEFYLSEPDATAKVSGLDGTTSVSADGKTITFTPTALEPSTSYTVTLEWCAGTVDLSFTTSALGEEMPDPTVLSGGTYSLDLRGARTLEPAGTGDLVSLVLETAPLLEVTGLDMEAGSMGLMMGTAKANLVTQDLCEPTADLPTASLDAPDFAIPPQDVALPVAGGTFPIQGFSLTGTFAADGSYFGGGTLSGTLDARALSDAMSSEAYNAEGLCELMASFGAFCAACGDGEPFCVDLLIDQITAVRVEGALVEVAAADCPGCDIGAPVCE